MTPVFSSSQPTNAGRSGSSTSLIRSTGISIVSPSRGPIVLGSSISDPSNQRSGGSLWDAGVKATALIRIGYRGLLLVTPDSDDRHRLPIVRYIRKRSPLDLYEQPLFPPPSSDLPREGTSADQHREDRENECSDVHNSPLSSAVRLIQQGFRAAPAPGAPNVPPRYRARSPNARRGRTSSS